MNGHEGARVEDELHQIAPNTSSSVFSPAAGVAGEALASSATALSGEQSSHSFCDKRIRRLTHPGRAARDGGGEIVRQIERQRHGCTVAGVTPADKLCTVQVRLDRRQRPAGPRQALPREKFLEA